MPMETSFQKEFPGFRKGALGTAVGKASVGRGVTFQGSKSASAFQPEPEPLLSVLYDLLSQF